MGGVTKKKKATKKSAAKKAVRKSAPKKQTAKKRAAKKVASKKTGMVKKKAFSRGVQKLSITDATPKKSEAKKEKRAQNEPIISKERVELAVLSPLRFPVQYDRLLVQTARVAGMAFIFAGTILTFMNVKEIVASYDAVLTGAEQGQVAAVLCTDTANPDYDPLHCIEDTTATSDGTTTTITTTTGTGGTADQQPAVTFSVSAPEPLVGRVTITYQVSGAERVEAHAFHRDSQTYKRFGSAVQNGHDMWEFTWDTTQYPDGEYRLIALVTNQYGSYENKDLSYVFVENIKSTDVAGADSTTADNSTVEGTETTPPASTQPDVVITSKNSEPFTGDVSLVVQVSSAEMVDLYLENRSTGAKERLGTAHYIGSERWEYVWRTEGYSDGTYKLYALITNQHGAYEDGHRDVLVGNTGTITESAEPVLLNETDNPVDVLLPPIRLSFSKTGTISGAVDVFIEVAEAQFIELYRVSNFAITPHFLGLAAKKSDGDWRFIFDTRQSPNGEHEIFARVKNSYGVYESDSRYISIFNERDTETTFEEDIKIGLTEETDKFIEEEYERTADAIEEPDFSTDTTIITDGGETDFSDEPFFDTYVDVVETQKEEAEALLRSFRESLKSLMDEFAVAERSGDVARIEDIERQITELREQVVTESRDLALGENLVEDIDRYLIEIVDALREFTKRNEEIIKERVGEQVFNDSDKDGISDYDEISLYKTDPFSADSDRDGFIDGAEILSGFDPTDSRPEALVAYESPEEFGVVREDILAVESIVGIEPDSADEFSDGVKEVAVISGRGLPNSFVTLYIFSTPIVVTVKTSDDGSWSYTFDKELEDGEHEVYVGVTDNAGRIVAKSQPLTFVKTAEAFTPTDAAAAAPSSPEVPSASGGPTILSENVLFALLSIIVVALGLVLLLLGMHMRVQEPKVAV